MADLKLTINPEYAALVPSLSTEEYQSLKQSIKQNDLWNPIVVNKDVVILDGHHRYKACQELGIKIKDSDIIVRDFPDKLHEQMFVIDSNSQRRHLNNFQRTELALKSKSILQEIAKRNQRAGVKNHATTSVRNLTQVSGSSTTATGGGGRVDEQIAKQAGVSRDIVRKVEAIKQAAAKKPHLVYLVERARKGKMSVNEADGIIKRDEDFAAEDKKKAQRLKLRDQVMKEDGFRCRVCGNDLHLDVYPISDHFQDKYVVENLETQCKDCHEIKIFEKHGLVNVFVYMFQKLTGFSGKRYFLYDTIGGNIAFDMKRNQKLSKEDEEMKNDPYVELRRSPHDVLVSKTRGVRERLIETFDYGDYDVYITQDALSQLLPVLRDFQEMIDKEADARRKKDEMSKG